MNPDPRLSLLLLVVVLLFLSAFFSGVETAFFSLSRFAVVEMEKEEGRKRLVSRLLAEPRKLLVTILFGNLLVNIASTSAVTAFAISAFGEKGLGIAMVFMTVLILIFGEIGPKSVSMRHARTIAVSSAPVMRGLMVLFTPVRVVLGAVADLAVSRSRVLLGERQLEMEGRELATAVEIGHRQGLLDEFEHEILRNLFLSTETTLREIQTPRVEVFTLDVETPLNEAIIQVRERGFSRVPVHEGESDNIVGILMARDLLSYGRDERVHLREAMREPLFAPGSKKTRELFGELISARRHMVIVVDEYGAFDGIVTLEDILEEIFGEIRDRREPDVPEYIMIDREHMIAEGAMRLEDVNDILGTALDSRDVETVGGYLLEEIGRIPREGESFDIAGLRFLVLSAEKTRVCKIKIERGERKETDGRR
ncbi:MAG: HlyC/CorC family transporter [Candidatus Krumholzibacteriota bacterium]|nr:HlyC/CorC family transporter [Candidatus Krumholzibacteriota bacterium]